MPTVTVIYGSDIKEIEAEEGALLGDVIAQTELPLEQPCAGRGTCGKCKVLVEKGAAPADEIEQQNLSDGEIALNNRLACRAASREKLVWFFPRLLCIPIKYSREVPAIRRIETSRWD
jgi:ferredoxin